MSSSLYWRPIPKEPKDYNIGSLKYIFREGYFDGEEKSGTLSTNDIPFVKGIKSGSSDKGVIKDCQRLIAAIEKHGEIEIYFKW